MQIVLEVLGGGIGLFCAAVLILFGKDIVRDPFVDGGEGVEDDDSV